MKFITWDEFARSIDLSSIRADLAVICQLVLTNSDAGRDLIAILVYNHIMGFTEENGYYRSNASTVAHTLAEEYADRSGKLDTVGQHLDVGVFYQIVDRRVSGGPLWKNLALFFNNSRGNIIHKARVKMDDMISTFGDGLGYALIASGMKRCLNQSLGHVDAEDIRRHNKWQPEADTSRMVEATSFESLMKSWGG